VGIVSNSPGFNRLSGANANLAIKVPVRCASTGPLSLSGFQTIDGVNIGSGDYVAGLNIRVLVKNQADATQNGIYGVVNSTWQRTADFDGNNDMIQGTRVYVAGGNSQSGDYVLTTADPIVVGTSLFAFAQI
jgi:hypothetical protein